MGFFKSKPKALRSNIKNAYSNGMRKYGNHADAIVFAMHTFYKLYGSVIDKKPTRPMFKGHLADTGLCAEALPFVYSQPGSAALEAMAQYLSWVLYGQNEMVVRTCSKSF